ncbi:hypothetical protein [Phocoenobacter skyensis]|uniref:Uncharacterized protein n=1 Tax=Phocoenobacter skyensis TaxID=97481 RepID=A0A1H7X545_9PAST|nr:hypothetical protein [Pasteurella skyensis]MDP8079581.1 hypothetical protein [Pasteurella skyensis]MDP8085530.1 hypothetical protein [Pasteurella skyensis]QLB21903.1 hypothetical protein A6B44_01245 [Pasteurella skyensis]SEM28248.1 hypothetical protein SAMN05444853_11114 [Pasteurella skyensis]
MQKAIFEILKTGRFNGRDMVVNFSSQTLAELKKYYSEDIRIAPLVLGHPENDKPQYGKVKKLFHFKDSLFAESEISEELVKKIKDGEISGVSCSVHFPASKTNPIKGLGVYLKHVGFLEKGKDEPAVKGMINPIESVSHINLNNGVNNIFLLNEDEFNPSPKLGELHQKALYFEKVLGIDYLNALDVIQ